MSNTIQEMKSDHQEEASDSKELGAEIKRLRTYHGIFRKNLALVLGVSERTLSRWETNGITKENYQKMEQGIKALVANQAKADLSRKQAGLADVSDFSTLQLATELLDRAGKMEVRERALDELKETLTERGLTHLLPEGF